MHVSKAIIPVALAILALLGVVAAVLGIAGHFPLYAAVLGVVDLIAVFVAGVLYHLCHTQLSEQQFEDPISSEGALPEVYDPLRKGIMPLLSADDLGRTAQTCTLWLKTAYDDLLWREHWVAEHGSERLPEGFMSYRVAFQYYRDIQAKYSRGVITSAPLSENATGIQLSGDTLCTAHKSAFGFTNLRLWDLRTRTEIRTMKGIPACPITIARWEDHLFCAHGEGGVQGLNLATGSIDFSWGERCSILLVEEAYLIIGNSHDLRVYEAASGRMRYQLHLGGNLADVKQCGGLLACAQKTGLVDLINLADGTRIRRLNLNGQLETLYIHQNSTAITGHENGSIEFWDLETETLIMHLDSRFERVKSLQSIGKILLSQHGNRLCVWDINTGARLRTIQLGLDLQFNASHMVALSKKNVRTINFSTN